MKTTAKKIIETANEYFETKQQIKELEKTLKSLKSVLDKKLESDGVLEAGERVVIKSEMKRSSLDKKKLIEDFGEDEIKKYERVTKYYKLEVK